MTAPYDRIADWYSDHVEANPIYREVILPNLLSLVPAFDHQDVLDVACGNGWVARELARRGARVTGVDISERLLAIARDAEEIEALGIRYFLDDAQSLALLPSSSFDGAICTMALMNLDDLPAAFRAVGRVLRPGGWLVFAIVHPCYQTTQSRWVTRPDGRPAREVAAYFDERFWSSDNPEGVRGKVGERHRMLSTYVNALDDAGFCVERLLEPQAQSQRAEQVPGNREVPSILLVRARIKG